MAVIGTWGTIPILDTELKYLKLNYALRYAILPIIYGDPYIQFVGKSVIGLEFKITCLDYYKTYDYWVSRKTNSVGNNVKNLTLNGVNFGDFYQTDTDMDWNKLHFFIESTTNSVIPESLLSSVDITIRGIQEVNI